MEEGSREQENLPNNTLFDPGDGEEDDDDFMTRIVHNSCQVVDLDGACRSNGQANQLDLLTVRMPRHHVLLGSGAEPGDVVLSLLPCCAHRIATNPLISSHFAIQTAAKLPSTSQTYPPVLTRCQLRVNTVVQPIRVPAIPWCVIDRISISAPNDRPFVPSRNGKIGKLLLLLPVNQQQQQRHPLVGNSGCRVRDGSWNCLAQRRQHRNQQHPRRVWNPGVG